MISEIAIRVDRLSCKLLEMLQFVNWVRILFGGKKNGVPGDGEWLINSVIYIVTPGYRPFVCTISHFASLSSNFPRDPLIS